MIGNNDVRQPVNCESCGADDMSCGIKLGLGGRRCCDQCTHVVHHDPRGGDR